MPDKKFAIITVKIIDWWLDRKNRIVTIIANIGGTIRMWQRKLEQKDEIR